MADEHDDYAGSSSSYDDRQYGGGYDGVPIPPPVSSPIAFDPAHHAQYSAPEVEGVEMWMNNDQQQNSDFPPSQSYEGEEGDGIYSQEELHYVDHLEGSSPVPLAEGPSPLPHALYTHQSRSAGPMWQRRLIPLVTCFVVVGFVALTVLITVSAAEGGFGSTESGGGVSPEDVTIEKTYELDLPTFQNGIGTEQIRSPDLFYASHKSDRVHYYTVIMDELSSHLEGRKFKMCYYAKSCWLQDSSQCIDGYADTMAMMGLVPKPSTYNDAMPCLKGGIMPNDDDIPSYSHANLHFKMCSGSPMYIRVYADDIDSRKLILYFKFEFEEETYRCDGIDEDKSVSSYLLYGAIAAAVLLCLAVICGVGVMVYLRIAASRQMAKCAPPVPYSMDDIEDGEEDIDMYR